MNRRVRCVIDEPLSLAAPMSLIDRCVCKLHTLWLRWTYPFVTFGPESWAHQSCDIRRSVARYISIGSRVAIDRDVWLNIPYRPHRQGPVIVIGDGCGIPRRCMISAQNRIHISSNTILGPDVLLMDHNHEFENVNVPIGLQGTTDGGEILIEEGCWIGFGAVIVCAEGQLVIGRNSVIGANSVVTRSVPRYSVVSGNPARVVKQFDMKQQAWVLGSAGSSNQAITSNERGCIHLSSATVSKA